VTAPALPPQPTARRTIFRQVALDRLGSAERLDVLMKVTDTQGWLALVACGLVLASALVWGVFGSIPSKLPASGILIQSAGLADVVSLGAGQITAIEVDSGDHVRKGDVIAKIAQPALQAELAGWKAQRSELERRYEKSGQLQSTDAQLRATMTAQARAALQAAIASSKQRERELRERLDAHERLSEKRLVTRELLLSTREALRTTQSALRGMQTDLQQLEVAQLDSARANELELQQHQARIEDNQRQIALLEQRLEQHSSIVSAYDGRIVALHAAIGDVLAPGQSLASLERAAPHGGLEALLYVDSRQSKRIKPDMQVEISPSMAERERYGVLRGRVRTIEDFPSTRRGMLRALRNEQLVDSLLRQTHDVPTAVRATLLVDPRSGSYVWSSRRGAGLTLTSGTRCSAAVITGTERPLALLFPTLGAVL
jgi:HlyD family secretion protein